MITDNIQRYADHIFKVRVSSLFNAINLQYLTNYRVSVVHISYLNGGYILYSVFIWILIMIMWAQYVKSVS